MDYMKLVEQIVEFNVEYVRSLNDFDKFEIYLNGIAAALGQLFPERSGIWSDLQFMFQSYC